MLIQVITDSQKALNLLLRKHKNIVGQTEFADKKLKTFWLRRSLFVVLSYTRKPTMMDLLRKQHDFLEWGNKPLSGVGNDQGKQSQRRELENFSFFLSRERNMSTFAFRVKHNCKVQ